VEYLPRTKGISSTELREEQFEPIKLGIVGFSKDTEKFIEEASFVVNINMNRIYNDEIKKIKKFTKNNKIKYGHDNYDEFLDTSINAVFINSSESNTYHKIKKALKAGKHVLCDNPISIEKGKLKKLKKLAKEEKKILLVELKTAFLPVFSEYKHNLEGCGFRYMIAEFGSLIQRGKRKSKILKKHNKNKMREK
jgi:predicted dehydrogenase